MAVTTETESPIVKMVIESREFKKAVKKIIEDASIEPGQIQDLGSEIEDIINRGRFETSFSA